MARITVEDCLDKVDNRFQLVMISSKRARQLQIEGKEPFLSADKDKPTVIALREIAEGFVDVSILHNKPKMEMELELEEVAVENDAEPNTEVKAEGSEEKAQTEATEEPPEQA